MVTARCQVRVRTPHFTFIMHTDAHTCRCNNRQPNRCKRHINLLMHHINPLLYVVHACMKRICLNMYTVFFLISQVCFVFVFFIDGIMLLMLQYTAGIYNLIDYFSCSFSQFISNNKRIHPRQADNIKLGNKKCSTITLQTVHQLWRIFFQIQHGYFFKLKNIVTLEHERFNDNVLNIVKIRSQQ